MNGLRNTDKDEGRSQHRQKLNAKTNKDEQKTCSLTRTFWLLTTFSGRPEKYVER